MRLPIIILTACVLLIPIPLSASDDSLPIVDATTGWSYSTYEDLQRAFSSVGQPKYTERDRKILDKALEVQQLHKTIFDGIEVGKSIFDYPGLIAQGTVRFDKDNPGKEYSLTLGIKPRFAGENDPEKSFTQFLIRFDTEGEITGKHIPVYKW